jgi:uncharacterized membrane protein
MDDNQNTPNNQPEQPSPVGQPPVGAPVGSDAEENKIWGIIAYLGIFFLVPLLARRESPFAQYHARQGLALTVLWAVLIAVGQFLSSIAFFGFFYWQAVNLLGIILFAIGANNVMKGKTVPLPVIGKFTENLKI